ncbi:RGG repeats nuclear RNA binding protein A-like isoform X2 [Andrographis paniculata]|uniref:RGG repeats nuclear RNA binding protein A-like isoform X2 n=1 Tax=Andrographis paniculata TaxID=175694 RepID=UPI0021E8F3C4|nr:RGG repeats nuclear RNA binding protein A-like isoform X2 [Andrographis paniculata]
MATANPFDLLGDDDAEDPSLLIAAHQQKIETKKAAAPSAAAGGGKPLNKMASPQSQSQPKLPSKPLPPAQAVREAKSEYGYGGRGVGGRGNGRGRGRGSYRDSQPYENSYGNKDISAHEADGGKPYERRGGYGGSRGPFRGGRRGGFNNGEVGEGDRDLPRRPFDRRSGTEQGNEIKSEGAGQGNWGTHSDELAQPDEGIAAEGKKSHLNAETPAGDNDGVPIGDKEDAKSEVKEEEPENKEMTLEEYEKVVEEKRKALQALKTNEERRVDAKEFASMQQLSNKKSNDHVFIKLGSEKDRKKDLTEKEERAKKSVSINEFLKPAEGERHYTAGSRGRGRGRGPRGGYSGGFENNPAPSIADPAETSGSI